MQPGKHIQEDRSTVSFRQEILIALGANLSSDTGLPRETLHAALARLRDHGLTVLRTSRFFATPCFPAGAGSDYVNACAVLGGDAEPAEVLATLHAVEAEFGRAREQRWGSRTLDLDLLAVGKIVLPDAAFQGRWRELPLDQQLRETPDQLILPHPRLQERAFVLVPLLDVAPDWRHPLLDRTVRELCAALPDEQRAEVKPV
ncbi:MAG: 2-amino-4-hydroxy-6-hydroxymethyldihydropteridine diphosphokinase [Yangia sp.]|nr:2-amino-4-hydroxy-6-hydroxymethyldihydropteridine diphosphokinase [Salipiger sp.]MAU45996.1 2-amino-4-hydroxy-6-hydroxymethyldihydropteridine diphosphokinase [Salipiger sp.]